MGSIPDRWTHDIDNFDVPHRPTYVRGRVPGRKVSTSVPTRNRNLARSLHFVTGLSTTRPPVLTSTSVFSRTDGVRTSRTRLNPTRT